MAEANVLFEGWHDYPPTAFLVKALVDGLAAKPQEHDLQQSPDEVNSVLRHISSKAGHSLPIIRGKDTGLPKTKPEFDYEQMRIKNQERALKKMKGIMAKNG